MTYFASQDMENFTNRCLGVVEINSKCTLCSRRRDSICDGVYEIWVLRDWKSEIIVSQNALGNIKISNINCLQKRTMLVCIKERRKCDQEQVMTLHKQEGTFNKPETTMCYKSGLMEIKITIALSNCYNILSNNKCLINSIIELISEKLFIRDGLKCVQIYTVNNFIHRYQSMIESQSCAVYLDCKVCKDIKIKIKCCSCHYKTIVEHITYLKCLAVPHNLIYNSVDSFCNVLKSDVQSEDSETFHHFIDKRLGFDAKLLRACFDCFSNAMLSVIVIILVWWRLHTNTSHKSQIDMEQFNISEIENVSDSQYATSYDDTSVELTELDGQTDMPSCLRESTPYTQILLAIIYCVQAVKRITKQVSFGYQSNKRKVIDNGWMKSIISTKTFLMKMHEIIRLSEDSRTSKFVKHKDVIKNMLGFEHVTEQSVVCYPFIKNLDELFSKMLHDEMPTVNERMSFEMMRLHSLSNFPRSSDQSLLRLAKAGFYYTGAEDRLICFSCGIESEGCLQGEDPVSVHRLRSPDCQFINNQESRNIPIGQIRDSQSEQSSPISGVGTLLSPNITQGTQNEHTRQHSMISHDGILSQRNLFGRSTPLQRNISVNGNSSNLASLQQHTPVITSKTNEQLTGYDSYNHSSSTQPTLRSHDFTRRVSNPDGSGIHSQFSEVKHIRYSSVPVRISSYVNWPRYMSQTPHDLAVAGFFSAGSGDCIRCFSCGIGLRNWQAEDNPWVEHARYSPNCTYLRMCKGEEFVQLVRIAAQELINETNVADTPVTRRQDLRREDITISELGIQRTDTGAESDAVEDPFETNAVRSVLEMGYSRNIIHKAMGKLVKNMGWSGLTSAALMEIILDDEVESANNANHSDKGATGGRPTNHTADTVPVDTLKEQNRELREKKLCKICFSEPLSVIFLPCAHLCCCVQCAQPLTKCPICRRHIKGSVRSYMD